jgi:hypothetical protein
MIEVDGRAAISSLRALHSALLRGEAETKLEVLRETRDKAKGTELFKDRSGRTRASIQFTSDGVVASGASRFLEAGTRPHEIRATNARALRFEIAGTVFFRKMVRHPGTAPRPFMMLAWEYGQHVAPAIAERHAQDAIRNHP